MEPQGNAEDPTANGDRELDFLIQHLGELQIEQHETLNRIGVLRRQQQQDRERAARPPPVINPITRRPERPFDAIDAAANIAAPNAAVDITQVCARLDPQAYSVEQRYQPGVRVIFLETRTPRNRRNDPTFDLSIEKYATVTRVATDRLGVSKIWCLTQNNTPTYRIERNLRYAERAAYHHYE